MTSLPLPTLLLPLSSVAPCGRRLRGEEIDPQLRDLVDCAKSARSAWRKACEAGEDPFLATAYEWREAQELAIRLLREESKDLEIACVLTEALLRTDVLAGLAEGLELIAALVGRYWSEMLERASDGRENDPQDAATALVWPLHRWPQVLAEPLAWLPLTHGDPRPFTLWQFERAVLAEGIDLSSKEGSHTITMEMLLARATTTAQRQPDYYTTLLDDAARAVRAIDAVDAALGDRLNGEDAQLRPDWGPVRARLNDVQRGINRLADRCLRAPEGCAAAAESSLTGSLDAQPGTPATTVDCVHFTVTAPLCIDANSTFTLDVWAHLEEQRAFVLERAQQLQRNREIQSQSKGPVAVFRGTSLTVRLRIDSLVVRDPEDRILWTGQAGNARFQVHVPPDTPLGSYEGLAGIYVGGLRIAKLYFTITIGERAPVVSALPLRQQRHRRAFASYAREDLNQVLGRLQGMQKICPQLEVFLDVLRLRSGQTWEQELYREIAHSDIFYLFWSKHARESKWVDREWRCALERRGIDFIDPVPLADPQVVPPPSELAGKHFGDWVLWFLKRP